MHYSMNDDGGRPRQIILDVLEESRYVLSEVYDATSHEKGRDLKKKGEEKWRTARETSGIAKRFAKV
jgi:hypothetical protein